MKTRQHSVTRTMGALLLTTAALSTGCLERELKPLNPCLVSGISDEVAVTNIDKVDILFMVDNSGSMREEQSALKAQFPGLVTVLATGNRMPGDPNPFPPAKDLHLGVVSSDMGLVGISGISGCDGFGDDGVLVDPSAKGCAGANPGQRFLAYTGNSTGTVDTAVTTALASNFGCVADLGTDGCGFEQQLEAPLKALWPSIYEDPKSGKVITPNPILFLKNAQGQGALGHGDVENNGFLRNDATKGLSLIAIIIVSDEEDCSSKTTDHFKPMGFLNAADPNYNVDLNLRCFYNKPNLYGPIAGDPNKMARYVKGYKALRDNPKLVIFGAIIGVPPDLVNETELGKYDFSNESSRNSFYDRILADPRMQETEDPNRPAGNGNLTPSCDTTTGLAYPPVRMVQMAKEFGENAVVQSICQDDFGPAMNAIIEVIAKQLGAVCLPRPLVRQSTGKVGCEVIWELPAPGASIDTTPTDCGGSRPWLLAPPAGIDATNDRKGKNCVVKQLPFNETTMTYAPEDGLNEGWYYDDFSAELMKTCSPTTPQRIAFTPAAKPPTGVTVTLECLNETQTVVSTDPNIVTTTPQPSIGTQCDKDATGTVIPDAQRDARCAVQLKAGTVDTSLICHPDHNVCVRTCSGDTDCPPAWVCDKRAETLAVTGKAICANPTCGNNE